MADETTITTETKRKDGAVWYRGNFNMVTAEGILAIKKGQILGSGLAPGSISGTQIADRAVTTVKMALLAVTDQILAAGAVTETKIEDDAVTTAKILANAVVADKIAAGSIITEKLATGAITSIKIAASGIEAGNINANAITAPKIASNAIQTVHLDAGVVTAVKMDVAYLSAIAVDAGDITAGTFTGVTFQTESQANRGIKITSSGLSGYDNAGERQIYLDPQTGEAILNKATIGGYRVFGLSEKTWSEPFTDTSQVDTAVAYLTSAGVAGPTGSGWLWVNNTTGFTAGRYIDITDITVSGYERYKVAEVDALGSRLVLDSDLNRNYAQGSVVGRYMNTINTSELGGVCKIAEDVDLGSGISDSNYAYAGTIESHGWSSFGVGNPTNGYSISSAAQTEIISDFPYLNDIPAGAKILGIEVKVQHKSNSGTTKGIDVSMSWDDGTTYSDVKTDETTSTSTETVILGGPTDKWGYEDWVPSDFYDGSFRMKLTTRPHGTGNQYTLDTIWVKVYYEGNVTTTITHSQAWATGDIKNYQRLIVASGVEIDVGKGVVVNVLESIYFDGKIDGLGTGYTGGYSGISGNGVQGYSYAGTPIESKSANYSGGGGGSAGCSGTAEFGGGGGGNGTAGSQGGDEWGGSCGANYGSGGGVTTGDDDFSLLYAGGGGGEGYDSGGGASHGSNAGNGGGSIRFNCRTWEIGPNGEIDLDGVDGDDSGPGKAGQGGGAGGTLAIDAIISAVLGTGQIHADGGQGGAAAVGDKSAGGNGGAGRIRVRCNGSITGTTSPTYANPGTVLVGKNYKGSYYVDPPSYQIPIQNIFLTVTRNRISYYNPETTVIITESTLQLAGDKTDEFKIGDTIDLSDTNNFTRERKSISAIDFGVTVSGSTTITVDSEFENTYTTSDTVERVDVIPKISIVAPSGDETLEDMIYRNSERNGLWTDDLYTFEQSTPGNYVYFKAFMSVNKLGLLASTSGVMISNLSASLNS